jgi:opacity protein-like surface antigen
MYKYLLINILFLFSLSINAQSKWGATVKLGDENSFFAFFNPTENSYHKNKINPLLEVGVSHKFGQGKRGGTWLQDFTIGYAHRLYEEKAFAVGTKIGYQWALWNKILVVPAIGVAYNRAKPTDVRYIYENNKWVSIKNDLPALNRFNAAVTMGIGYRINPSWEITANYQYALITNYIRQVEAPINILKSRQLAVRYWF